MSGGEIRGEKKISVWSKKYVEKLKKKPNFYVKDGKVKCIFLF